MGFLTWFKGEKKSSIKGLTKAPLDFDLSYFLPGSGRILYALFSENGKFISLDPSSDTFHEVDFVSELKIWDYQEYDDEELWFMGNNSVPRLNFTIRRIPPSEVEKLR